MTRMEPASSSATGIMATLFTATNIKWVLGGGALIYIIKLIYSAGRTSEKLDQVIEKVDEVNGKVDATNEKVDRNSAEHAELACDMAVMKNDIVHIKEKQG